MDDNRSVVVRRARDADLDGLVASAVALFAEDAGTHDPFIDTGWPSRHARANAARELAEPSRLRLVADAGGTVVGHLSGSVTGPSSMRTVRAAELISLYVSPGFRGSGLGSRLIEEFLTWARAQSAEQIEVTAYAANAGAIRLYERHGFTPQSVVLRAKP